jgi:hypothetical protein
MKAGRFLALAGAAAVCCASVFTPAHAVADDLTLSCSNGHRYYFRPQARTVRDEIVTAHLVVAPRRWIKMRLVPMGDGYRYAGRGVWLDGVGPVATLEFWKRPALSCTID